MTYIVIETNNRALEHVLNEHSRAGWVLHTASFVDMTWTLIFERPAP